MGQRAEQLGLTMPFHKRMAALFTAFSLFALVANLIHFDNPDHLLNVVELASLSATFGASFFLRSREAGAMQVASMILAAFIPLGITDSGIFGICIGVFAFVLTYAYGGFQSYAFWKLPVAFTILFALCTLAAGRATKVYSEMWFYGFCWSVGIGVFCWLLWLVADEHERMAKAKFDADVVELNRKLLDETRRIVEGCRDDAD